MAWGLITGKEEHRHGVQWHGARLQVRKNIGMVYSGMVYSGMVYSGMVYSGMGPDYRKGRTSAWCTVAWGPTTGKEGHRHGVQWHGARLQVRKDIGMVYSGMGPDYRKGRTSAWCTVAWCTVAWGPTTGKKEHRHGVHWHGARLQVRKNIGMVYSGMGPDYR